ncbi:MAG: hypothetical protein JNK48_04860 [Bryobacterales bacterium]|nr:hypothetical protein [Bryobacterales bacterium]
MKPSLFPIAIALAAPAIAQLQPQLVSNHDGSLLLFTTPQMRPTSAPPEMSGFILAIDNGNFRIYRQHGNPTLGNMDISADAKVLSTQLDASPRAVTTIEGVPGRPLLETDQSVRLSANGRFAVRFDHTANAYRWYLDSGRITYLTGSNRTQAPRNNGRLVANDGSAVLSVNGQVHFFPKDSTDLVHRVLSPAGFNATIDNEATTVLYSNASNAYQLHNLATGATETHPGRDPILSADGRKILSSTFDSPAFTKASLFDRDTNTTTPIETPPNSTYTLSGDGRIVWFLSPEGIHRFTVATAKLELLVPFPIVIRPEENVLPAVPGSLYSVFIANRAGITPQIAPQPLPETLDSFRVWIRSDRARIHSIRKRPSSFAETELIELRIQVPWNTALSRNTPITVERVVSPLAFTALTAFVPVIAVVNSFPLLFYSLDEDGRRFVTAEHSPLRTPVNYLSPARPNESIRILMTGLGPVSPAVETGHAGASPTVNSVACHLWTDTDLIPLEVQQSTLAVNTPGAYHVTVKLPASIPPTTETWISCDSFPLPLPFAP